MQKLDKIIFSLYSAAQNLAMDEFHEQALAVTKELVAFDSGAVLTGSNDSDADLAIRSLHLHNQPNETATDRQYLETPDKAFAHALQARGRCIAADSAVLFKGNSDFLAYCDKHAIAQSLVLVKGSCDPAQLDVITLWRAHDVSYSARDLSRASAILPHFFQAREINERIFSQNKSLQSPDNLSLVADINGRLYFVEERAIELLQLEWREWNPPVLPASMVNALRTNRSAVFHGAVIEAQATVYNNLLCVSIYKKLTQRGLSHAEFQAASLVADGCSYKEAARLLNRAPATVRNQLHSAYQKLGITNKNSLRSALDRASMLHRKRAPDTVSAATSARI